MKVIDSQTAEILSLGEATLEEGKKIVEIAGRTCYKSLNLITEGSAEKFVNRMIESEHLSTLEHCTIYLKLPRSKRDDALFFSYNKYSETNSDGNYCYVTTNYRVIVENEMEDVLKYQCAYEPINHIRRITVRMITNRQIANEFERHRVFSFNQESSRYCNYGKDKFDNEITFIKPCWLNVPEGKYNHCIMVSKNSPDIRIECVGSDEIGKYYNIGEDEGLFLNGLVQSELTYLHLINNRKWTPQQARSVLPLGIKSELISCGFEDAWENFFKRRDAPDAHPMAQEIANPMHKEFFKLTRAL